MKIFSYCHAQVFIDSCTDFIAHENVFVGIMMCGTPGGALPLGMYITNEMSTASMALIFDALKTILGEAAFNNKGNEGPESAMADEGVEIKGFVEVYPKCRRRRCCFHIFQNGIFLNYTIELCSFVVVELRWLSSKVNGVESEYRVEYFTSVQLMAYTRSKVLFPNCKLFSIFEVHLRRSANLNLN